LINYLESKFISSSTIERTAMALDVKLPCLILIVISIVAGGISLVLACVGIATPNWQITEATATNGRTYTNSTANFFYACLLNSTGDVIGCDLRSKNTNLQQYYSISAAGNQSDWNHHLNTAAGFSIIGIIFIFFGTLATILMLIGQSLPWIHLVAPSMLFVACLFMLAGLAEGARVLLFNGYAAHLYETAHLLTIFSFLITALVGGLLFNSPRVPPRS
jgi:hypothetical protein